MKSLLLALLLGLSLSTQAQIIPADWSTADTIRETAVVASLVLDYGQTMDIKHYPASVAWETNPILGRHPNDSRIQLYFATAILGHIYIATKLNPGIERQGFQYVILGLEVMTILHNKKVGYKFSF